MITLISNVSLFATQSDTLQDELYITTYPDRDAGYLAWAPSAGSSHFVIQVFDRSKMDTIITEDNSDYKLEPKNVLSVETDENYTRLDAQYVQNNRFEYQITEYSQSSEEILGIVSNEDELPPDCLSCGPEIYMECHRACNGPGYAYQLELWSYENSGSGHITINKAYEDTNEQGVKIPFYEAIPQTSMNSFDVNPYTGDYITPMGYYKRTGLIPADDVKDKFGNVLTGTVYMVGKDMGQYEYMQGGSTSELANILTLCGQDFGSGLEIWNNYYDFNSPYNNSPTELECQEAYNSPSGGDDDGDDDDDGIAEDYAYMTYCINSIGDVVNEELTTGDLSLDACDDEEGGIDNPTGISFEDFKEALSSIQIHSTDGDGVIGNFTTEEIFSDNGNDFYVAPKLNIDAEKGLYKAYYIFNDKPPYPIYFEHDPSTYDPAENADFASVDIFPNPIKNNKLKFEISSEKKMKLDIQVVSLESEILNSESLIIEEDEVMEKNLFIGSDNYDYNQLAVKIIFEDQSYIEEKALVPND